VCGCNEKMSYELQRDSVTPYRLSNGGESGSAAEVVDARHRGFSLLRRGEGSRTTFGMFFERQRQREEKLVSAIDVQRALQLVREFDGFTGVAALSGEGWQGEGVGA
jgi:hypothetical protein